MSSNLTTAVVKTPVRNTHKINIGFKKPPIPAHMALEAFLKPHTLCFLMVTTLLPCIHTVESRMLESNREQNFAAHGMIDLVRSQPFRFFISNFSAKAIKLT